MSERPVHQDDVRMVHILYKNWKGKTAVRRIIPQEISYEATQWHLEEQWLLHAYDVDKQAKRSFACRDILAWYTE